MNEVVSSETVLTREMLPVSNGRDDKLAPMLFVSTLLWAMLILGLTFEAGVLTEDGNTVSLEVTIVAEQKSVATPDKADYIAQADQRGNGNTREAVTPSAPAITGQTSPVQADNIGPEQQETTPGTQADQALLSTTDANRLQYQPDTPAEQEDSVARLAQTQPVGAEQTLPLPESDDPSLLIQDDNPRHLVISVNTKRSDLAPYVAEWKRRVERIGTQNFLNNMEASGRDGDPILAISISPDGNLATAELLRSSGDRVLDQTALVIVNRAAPFAPLPETVTRDKDLLRFAYKFRFRSGSIQGGATLGDN